MAMVFYITHTKHYFLQWSELKKVSFFMYELKIEHVLKCLPKRRPVIIVFVIVFWYLEYDSMFMLEKILMQSS